MKVKKLKCRLLHFLFGALRDNISVARPTITVQPHIKWLSEMLSKGAWPQGINWSANFRLLPRLIIIFCFRRDNRDLLPSAEATVRDKWLTA